MKVQMRIGFAVRVVIWGRWRTMLSEGQPGVKVRFGIGSPWRGRMGLGLGESLNGAELWRRLGLRLEVGLAFAASEGPDWTAPGWG